MADCPPQGPKANGWVHRVIMERDDPSTHAADYSGSLDCAARMEKKIEEMGLFDEYMKHLCPLGFVGTDDWVTLPREHLRAVIKTTPYKRVQAAFEVMNEN